MLLAEKKGIILTQSRYQNNQTRSAVSGKTGPDSPFSASIGV
jgi:hypothetical protein